MKYNLRHPGNTEEEKKLRRGQVVGADDGLRFGPVDIEYLRDIQVMMSGPGLLKP